MFYFFRYAYVYSKKNTLSVVMRCGWGSLALEGNSSRSFANSLHKNIDRQGELVSFGRQPF